MGRKRFSVEQIINHLREADVLLAQGRTVGEVCRRIYRTTFSAGSFERIDFYLIFVPFGYYDEPEILPYENPSIRPKGADVRQGPPLTDHGAF